MPMFRSAFVRGRFHGLRISAVVLLAALWASQTLTSYNLFIFNTILLATAGAMALNLLMGVAGQASIGNAAFLCVGAFTTVLCEHNGLPVWVDIPLAAVLAGGIGLLVGLPALRIVGIYLVLATLAAHFIVIYIADWWQTRELAIGGFPVTRHFQSTDLLLEQQQWTWVLVIFVIAVVLLVTTLSRGRAGRAWRMIRDHETAAPMTGIEVRRYKLLAFVISSAIIGVQGAFGAHLNGSVSADNFTLLIATSYIAMIVIGGLDSVIGAIVGASIVTWLPYLIPELVSAWVSPTSSLIVHSSRISQIVYGTLIVVFVTLSPDGIVGWARSLTARVRRLRSARTTDAAALQEVPTT